MVSYTKYGELSGVRDGISIILDARRRRMVISRPSRKGHDKSDNTSVISSQRKICKLARDVRSENYRE
jgi:hypothetical protein